MLENEDQADEARNEILNECINPEEQDATNLKLLQESLKLQKIINKLQELQYDTQSTQKFEGK